MGIVRDSQNFSGHPCMDTHGASRGHLCDSSAFLLISIIYDWDQWKSERQLYLYIDYRL